MRIVGRDKLDSFCAKHADTRRWIENWIADKEACVCRTQQDIKNRYA